MSTLYQRKLADLHEKYIRVVKKLGFIKAKIVISDSKVANKAQFKCV